MKLDCRFEAAHLCYAMLTVVENIKPIPMHRDVYESLKAFTPVVLPGISWSLQVTLLKVNLLPI